MGGGSQRWLRVYRHRGKTQVQGGPGKEALEAPCPTGFSSSSDLKNAHGAYKCAAAQRALEVLSATDFSLHSLALVCHSTSSQTNPIYVCSSQTTTGLKDLCESSAGGGQGNALANTILPVVIGKALKAERAQRRRAAGPARRHPLVG